MISYTIRPINPAEIYILEDFLYEAIFQRDETKLLPRETIYQPDIWVYIKDFGKPDDLCLVAEVCNEIVGAVWTRILNGEVKGFGNIDDVTPEFAISLHKEYRNQGIGTQLMRRMLALLKERGYKQATLSVQKDNYAARMYQKVGFKIIEEKEEEYLMIHKLIE